MPYGFDSKGWNDLEYFPVIPEQRTAAEVFGVPGVKSGGRGLPTPVAASNIRGASS